jgi:hypothetical protein
MPPENRRADGFQARKGEPQWRLGMARRQSPGSIDSLPRLVDARRADHPATIER